MTTSPEPFVVRHSDLHFLLGQVAVRSIFNAVGNALFGWHGVGAIHEGCGNQARSGNGLGAAHAIAAYGRSYAANTDLSGPLDVAGLNEKPIAGPRRLAPPRSTSSAHG